MADANQLVQDISEGVLATILIVGGVVIGLFGNKLHKAILFLLGFLAGVFIVYFILNNIGVNSNSDFLHYTLIIAIVVGICTGCLALWVYNTAIFTIGAIGGIIVAQFLWHSVVAIFPDIQYPEIYNIIIVIIFAIVFGILAVKFIGVIVKPLTAFIGSYMIVGGSAYFVEVNNFTDALYHCEIAIL